MRFEFTSRRELRLWLWTVAAVAAIYTTLGLARSLSDEIGNRELFDDIFFLAFVVLVVAVDIVGIRIISLSVQAISKGGTSCFLAPLDVRVLPERLRPRVRLLVVAERAPVLEPVPMTSRVGDV